MQKSNIEWTHFTSNPLQYRDAAGNVVWGCIHKSTGCEHCYAEALAKRYGRGEAFTAQNMKKLTPFLNEKELRHILTYKPAAGKMCFVGDMTDLFGEWVPFELLDQLFAVFTLRPDVTWQILTKRPERMREYITSEFRANKVFEQMRELTPERGVWSWPTWKEATQNVWLGVSVEDQKTAGLRIPQLLQTPSALRFVSYEPALEAVDFTRLVLHEGPVEFLYNPELNKVRLTINALKGCDSFKWPGLDWVIVGGESGHGARPFELQWARDVVRQCKEAGVACFVKQIGAKPIEAGKPYNPHGTYSARGKESGTYSRKGGEPCEWLEYLRVREVPEVNSVSKILRAVGR